MLDRGDSESGRIVSSAVGRRPRRGYAPTWTDRHFPWLQNFLARLDPGRFGTDLHALGEAVDTLLGGVAAPIDHALGYIGRRIGRAIAPARRAVEAVAQPLNAAFTAVAAGAGRVRRATFAAIGGASSTVPLPGAVRRLPLLGARSAAAADGPALQTAVKSRYDSMVWLSVIASVLIHVLVFTVSPTIHAADFSFQPEELTALELPPEIEIPQPPQAIPRPATPVVATAAIDEDITISPTTFDANPIEDLPPPPPEVVVEDRAGSEPAFTPYTVAPRVLNTEEVVQRLQEEYPSMLRDSGIGGEVVVWFHIDEEGRVDDARLFESSGFEQLDRAALRVAERVEFSPAMNRDRATAVWIQLPLEFSVR